MDPLASLINAREKAVPWRTVANRLLQLERSAPLAPDGQPWIRSVEAVSGYSANHIRRMSKASSLISVIESAWPEHRPVLSSLSFSHAEILGRLWETDAAQVEHLLKAKQWPSYAQLLARYEEARTGRLAPKAAGKLALGEFRKNVRAFLRSQFSSALLDRVPYHPYLKPDFLIALSSRHVMAWDCYLVPEKIDTQALHRRFVMWATESTFVDQFWIAVQNDRATDPMQKCIADLRLDNVGVTAGDRWDPIIYPHGLPTPDRRNYRPYVG